MIRGKSSFGPIEAVLFGKIDAQVTNVVAVNACRRHLLESLRRKPYQESCSS